jgi:hypothetical protein
MLDYFLCSTSSPIDGKSSGPTGREVCNCGRSPVVLVVEALVVVVFALMLGE